MTAVPPPPSSSRWYRVGMADLLFLLLLAMMLPQASRSMLDDPGLGWHLRTAEIVWHEGWPTSDPFGERSRGNGWLANQWLGETLLWLGERWAGLNGIAVVTILVLALAYRLLYGMMLAEGLPWPIAALATLAAASGSYQAWIARPNAFTFLFVIIVRHVCVAFHEQRLSPRALLLLPLLFALWANVHGGFVAGLVMLAATGGIEACIAGLALDEAARHVARRRLAWWTLASIAAFFATLLNPYGFRLYPWIFSLLGNSYFMNLNQEWLSPDFHEPGSLRHEWVILAFPTLLALSAYRPSLVALGLAVLWLHLGLQSRRYEPMFVVVTMPMLARAIVQIADLRQRWHRLHLSEDLQVWLDRPTPRPAWFASVVLALLLLLVARWGPNFGAIRPEIVPTASLDRVLQEKRPEEILFHGPNWGGYLIWKGWPTHRVWMDDRNEVYGQAYYEEYFAIVSTAPGWEAKLREHHVRLIAIESESILDFRLRESPQQWQEVYRDAFVVLYRALS